MSWNNPNETVVGGSGEVYVAAVGTALPAGPSVALNAAFVGLGYHTEDGVSLNQTPNVVEHQVWQSRYPIRRELDTFDFQITFSLVQFNEETVKLAFGGGSISSVSGGYKYTPPQAGEAIDERALVVDVDDGSERTRIVVPRGSVTEAVDVSYNRGALGALPITFKALQPADGSPAWYPLFSDSTAFMPGS